MSELSNVSEVIALSMKADNLMTNDPEIWENFKSVTAAHCNEKGVYYVFENQDWYDPEIYAILDTRLSFLCSLPLEDYAYLRVEPGEPAQYGGDIKYYGLEIADVANT